MVEIKSIAQLAAENGAKIIVFGDAGVGKTTLLRSLKPGTFVAISAERGLRAVADLQAPGLEVNNIADFNQAYQIVMGPQCAEYDTVLIDSISEIAEQILAAEKFQVNDPRQAYGALIDQMIALLKSFRDISGKNIVLLAKEETFQAEGIPACYRPSLPGSKLGNAVPYLFDVVLHMQSDFSGARTFKTQPDGISKAKDRSGKLLPVEDANHGLQYIIDKILAP
jgi:phage nucleotide-binding protein